MRNLYLGFVYQFHHLLAEFNALENISMPLLIGGYSRKDALQKSQIMLERVGLLDRASHNPQNSPGRASAYCNSESTGYGAGMRPAG